MSTTPARPTETAEIREALQRWLALYFSGLSPAGVESHARSMMDYECSPLRPFLTTLDAATAQAERTAGELAAAEARIAVLEAALSPFAAEADRYDPDEGDRRLRLWATPENFRIGDLRAARAALTEEPPHAAE